MSADLREQLRIAREVCAQTGGHRLEGTATLMRCGGWTYVGRCQQCGLGAIGHAHGQRAAGGSHETPAG